LLREILARLARQAAPLALADGDACAGGIDRIVDFRAARNFSFSW